MDSYRLIPQLEHLQLSAAEAFEGATGMLWVDALRQIHRRLPWARFRRGVPQVLGYPPALPSPVPPQSSAGDGPAPRLPAPTP